MHKIIALGCAAWLCIACTQDEVMEKQPEVVEVNLSLNVTPQLSAETRAASPLIPDVENLIYNIWVVQYDQEGIITKTPAPTQYRADAAGLLTVSEPITLATGNSTVCMLVNMGYGSKDVPITFPDNLTAFKNLLAGVDVEAAADGTLARMPMCGYWQGEVTTDTRTLNVTLGRMMTRINLVLSNGTGAALTNVTAQLTSVPNKAHVFPSITSSATPATEDYTTLTDAIGTINNNASVTRYFYIAPNLWEKTPTTLTLSAAGKADLPIELGNDAPGVTGGSKKLYPNNIYTFTINLKKQE